MAQALLDMLDPRAIVLGVKASSNEEVIRSLASRLEALGYVKASYADAVVAREKVMPTGLPLGGANNVAVPHTDPQHVIRPGLALATLDEPVQFSNMEDPDDRIPVGIVFLMALNDKDKQVEMLQEIVETIQSPESIAALIAANSAEDVLGLLG